MSRQDASKEIEKMQQTLKESEKAAEKKKGSRTGNIVRQVLMYGALALILAVVIMAILNR